MKRALILLAGLALAGCGTPEPKTVIVTKTAYIATPVEIRADPLPPKPTLQQIDQFTDKQAEQEASLLLRQLYAYAQYLHGLIEDNNTAARNRPVVPDTTETVKP